MRIRSFSRRRWRNSSSSSLLCPLPGNATSRSGSSSFLHRPQMVSRIPKSRATWAMLRALAVIRRNASSLNSLENSSVIYFFLRCSSKRSSRGPSISLRAAAPLTVDPNPATWSVEIRYRKATTVPSSEGRTTPICSSVL
jgi:hypothetical protein